MKFFSLEMKDFCAAASVHIYEKDGEVVRIVNKKDKDKNTYYYIDGELRATLSPGSEIDAR